MAVQEIRVPNIGEFTDVPVIEVHVAPGATVAAEDPLLTLESDKATLDVPAPVAGTVTELRVAVGDTVSEGSVIALVDAAGPAGVPPKERVREGGHPAPEELTGYGSAAGVYDRIEVTVPDIGEFTDVPVIEVHVTAGDTVAAEDPLLTLESDKATMDVPSPAAGTVAEVLVAVGDTVSEGSVIAHLTTGEAAPDRAPAATTTGAAAAAPAAQPASGRRGDVHAEVLVLGAGPGGYTAAFRAADLDQQVVLVDGRATLGGVCLNVGCIPSKALLHAAKVIAETREMAGHGISFGAPTIDVDGLRGWKDGVVSRLTGGLAGLARQRKVTTLTGTGRFASPRELEVTTADGAAKLVTFDQAIIAAGSEPVQLPFVPHDDPRVIDSTGALDLADIPERLLVLGGGIIGLEMACVYAELGSRDHRGGADGPADPRRGQGPGHPADQTDHQAVRRHLPQDQGHQRGCRPGRVDRVVRGRQGTRHRGLRQGAGGGRPSPERPGDRRRERRACSSTSAGSSAVDKQQRTNVAHIYAIGDVVGQPMLAHKAVHEGRVAAENAAGHTAYFDATVIPSVAYTDPEVAWVGAHRERGPRGRGQVRQRRLPVGGVRPVAVAGPRRGHDQGAVRRGHRADHRLRHRRPQRRRPHRRSRARHRTRRRRRRHRRHHPPPPHPVRDRGHVRRSLRRNHHRPLPAQEEEPAAT